MNNPFNYLNSFPDFLTMQRTSFCWFISRGILQELNNYLKLFNFSANVQYRIYPEEYQLLVPPLGLRETRKFCGSYKTQLLLPIEIRDKTNNVIRFNKKFPLLVLPLMSKNATFYLNGCDRIIVSQIVRSPGIYFEKNKKQKKQNPFNKKLSPDIKKLRTFLPSGEAFVSEWQLFLATPTVRINKNNEEYVLPEWENQSVKFYPLQFYSLRSLKNLNTKSNRDFCFLYLFYVYLQISAKNSKKTLVRLFFKWVKVHSKSESFTENSDDQIFLLTFLRWVKSLLKVYKKKLTNIENFSNNSFKYQEIFKYSLKILHIWFNRTTFLVNTFYGPNLTNFYFLKLRLKNQNDVFESIEKIIPTTYYLNTIKDQLFYSYTTRRKTEKVVFFKKHRLYHKYTKSKTKFLLFNNDHKVETFYNKKYNEKEYYNAIIIPESGSWVRFGFQKNTKLSRFNYPIKNLDEDIVVKLDKITQTSVINLLKEVGLTDFDIYQNLKHNDFFYCTQPLLINSPSLDKLVLKFNINLKPEIISEFSKIFNTDYYRLNKIGRFHFNRRLNISISPRIQSITYEDIFAIIDKLIELTISKTLSDDIDHLKNRRVRSIGEILQNLISHGYKRLARKLENQANQVETDSNTFSFFQIVNITIREFFASSQLSQYLDQTNPLSSITHRRRISGLGPGGFDRNRISFSVRDIHPSHYGRVCPIETPEGQNVGLIASLTTCARVNKSGFLETPFWRVINGKVIKSGVPVYLTADIEDLYKIAPADIISTTTNYLIQNLIPVRFKQDFLNVAPWEIDFISVSPIQVVSVATSLIPFFEHDDANRALMGSNMQRQSVPLLSPQKPIVGTGLEYQVAIDSGMALNAQTTGTVDLATGDRIVIKNFIGTKNKYFLNKYLRSNQQTCINQKPIVWKGEKIESGQLITDGPSVHDNELALGQNVLVAYMPWQGYNFEDAILINERLVYEDIFSSIHIERYKVEIDRNTETMEQLTKEIPNLSTLELKNLHKNGIVKIGTFVKPGMILVGKIISDHNPELLPESRLLCAIFGTKSKIAKDNSYRMPDGHSGRIIETVTFNRKRKMNYLIERIYIFIAQIRKIQVGDKIAGRHGNKGIISRILASQDMPFLPDGTSIDIILNPLGVPSRMNVGQLYECLLGLAGDRLNCRFKILPFDEMYGLETSRILVNKKLRHASISNSESWLFNPYTPGKIILIDGRTGKEFENPITVGNAYMLKLIHLVDDKMHARATGPYSLITQQPLRGKAQHGGQRFGEMEVWALEGFGAAFTLKELLTVKSDDMDGRTHILNAIVRNQPIPEFGIPESFKVLLQELRSIGLDMATYKIQKFNSNDNYQAEVDIVENYKSFLKQFSPSFNFTDITF